EIETVLASHLGVRECAVVARVDASGEKGLVAYVVPCQEPPPEPSALRAHLRERLPAFMLPTAYVLLDRLPRNSNDKLDYAALPPAERSTEASYVAPATETERTVARIWAEVLGVDRVSREDDFFDLGGHSLTLFQLQLRLQSQFGGGI